MADGPPQTYRHGPSRHQTSSSGSLHNNNHHPPLPPPPSCSAPNLLRPLLSEGQKPLPPVARSPSRPSPQQLDGRDSVGEHHFYNASCLDREEGYDYDFVPQVDGKYECPICLLVLRGTIQTNCGHRFCNACIHRWLRDTGGPKCPVCNDPITESNLFPDKFADREIMSFTVRCPNNKYGCNSVAELKHLDDHLTQFCDYVLVPCPNHCTNVLYKKDIDWHCAKECVKRETPCELCGQKIPTLEKDKHKEVCLGQQVSCQYCQSLILRKDKSQHFDSCEMAPTSCIFKPIGCTAELTRNQVSKHNQEETQFHLSLTARALNKLFQAVNITCHFAKQTNSYPLVNHQNVADTGIVLGADPRAQTTQLRLSETDFDQHRQRVASEGECISGHTTEVVDSNPFSTTSTFLSGPQFQAESRLFGAATSFLDGGVRPPSYVNLPLSDPVRLKIPSPAAQGEGDAQHNNNNGGSASSKPAEFIQQLSCEESLRFGAEGGVDFLEKSRQQEASVARLKQLILELQAKVTSLEKRQGEHIQIVNLQKEKLQKQDDLIAAFEGRNCNGVYIWKIREFTRLRQEALNGQTTVLHSPGFYTSYHGYKLCIRANLNGVEGGNGSHISIFVHFMRGEFDVILDWPFRGKIILTVMDQGEHKQHITEVLESKPTLAAFQRPQSNRNHKGFGYIEFAPVALIERSTYCLNDTLILKAEVSELP